MNRTFTLMLKYILRPNKRIGLIGFSLEFRATIVLPGPRTNKKSTWPSENPPRKIQLRHLESTYIWKGSPKAVIRKRLLMVSLNPSRYNAQLRLDASLDDYN